MPSPTDEQVIFQVRPSIIPFLAIIIALTVLGTAIALMVSPSNPILTIAILIIVAFVDLVIILTYANTIYTLTNDRLTHQAGVIGIKIETIQLDEKIAEVRLQQGLLGRLFNYGDIQIEGDNPQAIFVFQSIGSPKTRYEQIRAQMMHNPPV